MYLHTVAEFGIEYRGTYLLGTQFGTRGTTAPFGLVLAVQPRRLGTYTHKYRYYPEYRRLYRGTFDFFYVGETLENSRHST